MKPSRRSRRRRRWLRHLPILALITVDEEANCLDGSSPEVAAREAGVLGRGRDRRELQHGPGDGADGVGAGGGGD